jgi:hypothetical protein
MNADQKLGGNYQLLFIAGVEQGLYNLKLLPSFISSKTKDDIIKLG